MVSKDPFVKLAGAAVAAARVNRFNGGHVNQLTVCPHITSSTTTAYFISDYQQPGSGDMSEAILDILPYAMSGDKVFDLHGTP